jgi:RNA polymerase-binding transcription factor DksA
MATTTLADSTINRLRVLLLERRRAVEHASITFHAEATEAIETADMSDVLDDEDPDSNGAEGSLLIAVNADVHLRDIDEALQRMALGEFGICEDCGDRIPLKRLQTIPETPVCVGCSRKRERH